MEMDILSKDILKELLPAEKEVAPPAKKRRARPGAADHWPNAVLLERGAYLRKLAKLSDGSASETLKEYPEHATMLSFRSRSGEAEVHANFADIFYVLEGRATLATGGTVVRPRTVAPGEVRGEGIDGGERQELRPGDVAHVPAGEPHQMLLTGDKTMLCFVVKVRETP